MQIFIEENLHFKIYYCIFAENFIIDIIRIGELRKF